MSNRSEQINPNRPEPIILDEEPFPISKKTNRGDAAKILLSGTFGVVADRYSTGMAVLSELKKQVFKGKKKQHFAAYRDKRSQFYYASNRLLVPVKHNQIALKNSPETGWLEKLYPDVNEFFLTFPQVQGLNSSWQWYLRGLRYPGLRENIHPWYGTYFPTRFDHLHLFDNWLKKYEGPKASAIDIGTGCGVLAFQMLNRGFGKVTASDINPNAVLSVIEHSRKLDLDKQLRVFESDLFDRHNEKADLVIFNPPWLPAQKDVEGLDGAIYYQEGLFERFFDEAADYLTDGGCLVILFSNLAESAGISERHPVKDELANHHRYKKAALLKRKVKEPSGKTKRRNHRKNEFVELWVLEKH